MSSDEFLQQMYLRESSTPNNLHNTTSSSTSSTSTILDLTNFSDKTQLVEVSPPGLLNLTSCTDRGPQEYMNENLVNEAREKEKAFFESVHNENYLTDDSSRHDFSSPLPLYMTDSNSPMPSKSIRVDSGSPMIYQVKIHAEQVIK